MSARPVRSPAVVRRITQPTTLASDEVRYTGRTGAPLPGCDCVQCFGYCLRDHEVEQREMRLRIERRLREEDSDAL